MWPKIPALVGMFLLHQHCINVESVCARENCPSLPQEILCGTREKALPDRFHDTRPGDQQL